MYGATLNECKVVLPASSLLHLLVWVQDPFQQLWIDRNT